MAIVIERFIVVSVKASDRLTLKQLTKYLHVCDNCSQERGYFIKTFEKYTKNSGLCRSCAMKLAPTKSAATREKMSKAKIGKPGHRGAHSDETKTKMRQIALSRKCNPMKGKAHNEDTKRKISCARKKINLVDFDGFLTEEDETQRRLFKAQGLHWKCFERDEYICDYCNTKRTNDNMLNAHHLDGWNWAIDQRFNLNNLVTLCEKCHAEFHRKYGKGHNTKEQYEGFRCQKLRK